MVDVPKIYKRHSVSTSLIERFEQSRPAGFCASFCIKPLEGQGGWQAFAEGTFSTALAAEENAERLATMSIDLEIGDLEVVSRWEASADASECDRLCYQSRHAQDPRALPQNGRRLAERDQGTPGHGLASVAAIKR